MINISRNSAEAIKHHGIVKPLIVSRINSVLASGSIGRKHVVALSVDVQNYLRNLLIGNNLDNLILVDPQNLPEVITGIRAAYPNFTTPNSDDNKVLKNVFLEHGYKKFDKLTFLKRLNLDTCPYCNRNYIYYLSKSGRLKPQIDHFFPTSIYPFLAVTYYNLIPSCQTCNGFGAKEGLDPLTNNLVNPYLLKNSNFRFNYKIRHINFYNPLVDKTSIEVGFRHSLPGHVSVFKLDKLYQQHADHVLELIVKSKLIYSKAYRTYLRTYAGFQFSNSEIDRMILGNYSQENELHKRPLAKLYQDIGQDLGLI